MEVGRLKRPSAAARGYDKDHWRWRHAVFQRDSHCRMCGAPGQPSDHADHIVPVNHGGPRLAVSNGQRLCRTCHNSVKQAQDKSGVVRGCDEHGIPLDPAVRQRWGGGLDSSTIGRQDRSAGIARTFAKVVTERAVSR